MFKISTHLKNHTEKRKTLTIFLVAFFGCNPPQKEKPAAVPTENSQATATPEAVPTTPNSIGITGPSSDITKLIKLNFETAGTKLPNLTEENAASICKTHISGTSLGTKAIEVFLMSVKKDENIYRHTLSYCTHNGFARVAMDLGISQSSLATSNDLSFDFKQKFSSVNHLKSAYVSFYFDPIQDQIFFICQYNNEAVSNVGAFTKINIKKGIGEGDIIMSDELGNQLNSATTILTVP